MADFYEILGISRTAPPTEVRKAYMSLARERHPDRFSDPAEKARAQDDFQRATEAFNTLCNDRAPGGLRCLPRKAQGHDAGGDGGGGLHRRHGKARGLRRHGRRRRLPASGLPRAGRGSLPRRPGAGSRREPSIGPRGRAGPGAGGPARAPEPPDPCWISRWSSTSRDSAFGHEGRPRRPCAWRRTIRPSRESRRSWAWTRGGARTRPAGSREGAPGRPCHVDSFIVYWP